MSQAISRFPKRFNAHPIQESDGTFLFLLLLLGAMLIPVVMHLRSLPPAELSQAEREKYLRVIYRAPEVIVPSPTTTVETPSGQTMDEEVEEGPTLPPARETLVEREQRRQREALTRSQRRESRLKKIRSTALFTAAGAIRPGYGLQQGEGALGLIGGSLEGIEARSKEQIAVRPDVSELDELKAVGLIRDEVATPRANLEVQLDSLNLAGAEVRLDALPVLRGRASPDSARRIEVLRSAIAVQLESLRGCFLVQRRRDPSLQGQLVARVTVAAMGSVERVQFRSSRWSNPSLGRRVEACLEQQLLGWQFDPAEGTSVTLEFPLLFGGADD
ncbi:AgmX/PglI C-terminal domain-containing protein [bacterium]|nr:AgmX/PglI C-terminal domain-containing protein [bacterium]